MPLHRPLARYLSRSLRQALVSTSDVRHALLVWRQRDSRFDGADYALLLGRLARELPPPQRAKTAHFDAFLARLHERLRESAGSPVLTSSSPDRLPSRLRANAAGEHPPSAELFSIRSLAALSATLSQLRLGNEVRVQPALDVLAVLIERRALDCATAELTLLVVALARSATRGELTAELERVASSARARAAELDAAQLLEIARALAAANACTPHVGHALARRAAELVRSGSLQEIDVAASLALALDGGGRTRAPRVAIAALLEAIASAVVARSAELRPQSIARLCVALTQELGVESSDAVGQWAEGIAAPGQWAEGIAAPGQWAEGTAPAEAPAAHDGHHGIPPPPRDARDERDERDASPDALERPRPERSGCAQGAAPADALAGGALAEAMPTDPEPPAASAPVQLAAGDREQLAASDPEQLAQGDRGQAAVRRVRGAALLALAGAAAASAAQLSAEQLVVSACALARARQHGLLPPTAAEASPPHARAQPAAHARARAVACADGAAADGHFDALGREAMTRGASLSDRQLAQLAWALASARAGGAAHALDALAPHATRALEREAAAAAAVQSRGTAPGDAAARDGARASLVFPTLAWAYAHARVRPRPLALALARCVGARAAELRRPRHLAMAAWALASSGVRSDEAYAALSAAIVALAPRLAPRELSACAWALATARVHEPRALAALGAAAQQLAPQLGGRELATVLWAFAAAPHAGGGFTRAGGVGPRAGVVECALPSSLFARLAAAGEARVGAMGPPQLCLCAWALAMRLEVAADGGAFARALWRRLCKLSAGALRPSELQMLGQFALSTRVHAPALALPDAPDALRLAARDAAVALRPSPSAQQRALSAALAAAGWPHEHEASLEDGLLNVDMACSAARVAVELDGRDAHTLRDPRTGEHVVSGTSEWKAKTLRALGWRVVHVASQEWAAAQRSEEAMRAFLARVLEAVGRGSGQ